MGICPSGLCMNRKGGKTEICRVFAHPAFSCFRRVWKLNQSPERRVASLYSGRPQRNVINFLGLVAEVIISASSEESNVEGGLVLTQAHRGADVWMFGYLDGDYQGLALVENAQPRTLCQEAVALNVAVNKIFF